MNNATTVSTTFLARVKANIAFWQQKTAQLDDLKIPDLNQEFPNLLRAVQIGILHPATRSETAVLVCHVFFWVEQAGHGDSWLPILDKLLPLVHEPDQQCRLYRQKGQLLRAIHQPKAAQKALEKAAALAQHHKNAAALVEAQIHLCSVYLQRHQYQQAREIGHTAMQQLNQAAHRDKLAAALHTNLGLVEMAAGHLNQAERQLKQGVQLGRAASPRTQLARMLNTLAIVLHRQGKHSASKKAFEEALTLIEPTASRVDKIYLQLSLGALLVDMDCFDQAEDLFLQAEKTMQTIPGQFPLRAMIANNLGSVLLQKKQPIAAEHYLQRCIDLRRQLNIRLPLANAYKSLAQAHFQQGQREKAAAALDAALLILPEFQDNAWARQLFQECVALRENSNGL